MKKIRILCRNKRAFVGMLVFAFVLAARPNCATAGVGDLKLIAFAPQTDPFRALAMSCTSFAPLEDDSGAVNEDAVATRISGESLTLMIAVDSLKPDADKFDVIRFDFSGKGQFGGAPAFQLKEIATGASSDSGTSVSLFGPTAATVLHDGRKIPVFVEGVCSMRHGEVKSVRISVGVVADGSCRFGDKIYGVRVVAADCRLGVNNAAVDDGSGFGSGGPGLQEDNPDAADVVMIDTERRAFKRGVVSSPLGQLAYIDGKWYRVLVSQDGLKISAKQIAAETGSVSVAHDKWAATLIGEKYILSVRGGKRAVCVPADSYVIRRYREYAQRSGASRASVLTVAAEPDSDTDGLSFSVTKGTTTQLKIGSPLMVKVKVDSMGSGYAFGFSLADVSGMKASVSLPGQPPAPVVKIVGAEDKEVYSGEMEYG